MYKHPSTWSFSIDQFRPAPTGPSQLYGNTSTALPLPAAVAIDTYAEVCDQVLEGILSSRKQEHAAVDSEVRKYF